MSSQEEECLPAYRGPVIDYKKKRVEELQKMLDENAVDAGQRENILFAINIYKTGEYDGRGWLLIQDGKKVSSATELHARSPWWMEGIGYQLAQYGAYGSR